jgi:pyruvate carboxylase
MRKGDTTSLRVDAEGRYYFIEVNPRIQVRKWAFEEYMEGADAP